MNIQYGSIVDKTIFSYLSQLVNNIYKVLPLKEQNCNTLDVYISSLIREIIGYRHLIESEEIGHRLIAVVSVLEHIRIDNDHKTYKSDVFKCINIINQIQASIKDGDGG